MLKVLLWTVSLYVLFKICHVNFSPRKRFGRGDLSLRDQMASGEPWVFFIALAVAALINLYSYWFVHRLARREVAHATECYGRVSASDNLAGINDKFDYWLLETFTVDARNIAVEHARWIGMNIPAVESGLAKSKAEYASLYYRLSRQRDVAAIHEQMTQIDRCLNDQWAPHGQIFNP